MSQPNESAHPLGNALLSLEIWKKTLFNSNNVPNYTFEQRYVRGTPRPTIPARDEIDRLNLLRVESIPARKNHTAAAGLLESVLSNPEKVAYTWCDENGVEVSRITYRELYDQTRSLAAQLLNNYKLTKGDRVLLVYEPCIEFFPAFWACIVTGIIPAPVCPPDPFNLDGDHADKLTSIYIDSQPKAILTSSKYKDSIAAARLLYPDQYLQAKAQIMDFTQHLWIPTDTLPHVSPFDFEIGIPPFESTSSSPSKVVSSGTKYTPMFEPTTTFLYKSPVSENDVAFLQYTSGSTGMAKGVIVHHRTLCANIVSCALLTGGVGQTKTYQWGIGVSWLPTFHDMGLIGFHVTPMIIGGTMVYQSPIHFIQNPVSWLQIISRYNQVFTGAPPFALDLLVKRTSSEELAELNLSGLDSLVLGAEPIRSSYMEAFAKKFKPAGFTPEHYITCFGMAENILHVTGKWGNTYGVNKILVDSQSLRQNQVSILESTTVLDGSTTSKSLHTQKKLLAHHNTSDHKTDETDHTDTQWLVSSGELVPFHTKQKLFGEEVHLVTKERCPNYFRREYASHVIIVDPNTLNEVPDGHVGEVWILSPSKTAGYWNRPELSKEQFHAVLNTPFKQDTIDLLHFVTKVVPNMYSGVDLRGNIDPSSTGKSATDALNSLLPQTNVLLTSLSTTTTLPGSNTLHVARSTKDTPVQAEWLRTGDTGLIYNSHIYITGRIKDMIILRGQNFYADDIEHAVSTDTDDFSKQKADGTVKPPSPSSKRNPALDFIRPGHCVAYSIELAPNGQVEAKNDPVLKAGVEGEHLCLLVELSGDVINSITAEGREDTGSEQFESGAAGKSAPVPNPVAQKTGNQAPLWQRVLNTHSKAIIGGMASMNTNDLDAIHREEEKANQSCCDTVAIYSRAVLFSGIRLGMNTAQIVSKLLYPSSTHNSATSSSSHSSSVSNTTTTKPTSTAKTDKTDKINSSDAKLAQLPQEQISADLDDSKLFLPPDNETRKLQKLYPQAQLNSIAAAIRRVISTKFLLIVDKIVFISPRTIKKTSSGKKRRNDTVFAVENHYYEHRVVGYSYSKPMQVYQGLIEKQEKLLGLKQKAITNQSKSFLSKAASVSEATTSTTSTSDPQNVPSNTSTAAIVDDKQKYAGTVGVSLHSSNTKYSIASTPSDQPSIVHSSSATINNTKQHMLSQDGYTATLLLPNTEQFEKTHSTQHEQYAIVTAARTVADKATFETIKPRVLSLICREINTNIKAQQTDIKDDETTSFASSEKTSTGITFEDGNSELTVKYLEQVSTYSGDRQQELLDEFGLDSLTGFKLSKAFAVEFGLPQSGLGPHIFLNDPTLDGVSRVILNMIKSNAAKLTADYEAKFKTKYTPSQPLPTQSTLKPTQTTTAAAATTPIQPLPPPPSTTTTTTTTTPHFTNPTNSTNLIKPLSTSFNEDPITHSQRTEPDYDTHDKTAAFVFRGTTDHRRIPYILGIGTAVPHIGAPQSHVIEAMLGPMKLDDKGAERFRKIGQHSGVDTRYSVLDNLGQIFWGKEGVNMDHDEFIDARQAVYKREAVKLSIQSSADAVRDWLGEKVYLNDQLRDEQRDKVYKQCEELHRKYEVEEKLKQSQKPAESVDKTTELAVKQLPQHLNPALKSFAEGDQHVVPTTSGDAAQDKVIAQLGQKVLSSFNRTITHIVAITCTGIIVPGLEFHIMQALQLPLTTQRLPITFAGCFGAISGLRTASALAAENPAHRVLVVCTELCTLHMQLNDKIDNLIASALFADGSGAFIVGCAPTPKETPIFSIDTLSSFIIPNTVQQMAWEATKSGMVIGLAKEIASEIFHVIDDVVDDMLKYTPDPANPQHRIHPSNCNMAIHPGGPLIINTIQSVFGLDHIDNATTKALSYSHPVAETWKILNEYGNMSSATLVFVLDRIREQQGKFGKPTPALAFGPGLNIECALLHCLEPKDKTHPRYKNANHK